MAYKGQTCSAKGRACLLDDSNTRNLEQLKNFDLFFCQGKNPAIGVSANAHSIHFNFPYGLFNRFPYPYWLCQSE
jgi:hypothetical protein